MKYLSIEGEDIKKIKNQLKTTYGNEIYILNVKQEQRGLIKKKNYYVVTVGIPDNVYEQYSDNVSKTKIRKTKKDENSSNYLFNPPVDNKEKSAIESSKISKGNDIIYNAKTLIDEKSKSLSSLSSIVNKIPVNNLQNNINGEELKEFFSLKLEEFEKKLELFSQNFKNNKEEALIDKFIDSLEHYDFSKDYLTYLKDKFKKSLTYEESQSIEIIKSKVYEEIENNIKIENNKFEKGDVIVLVGPTGVGKTTTLVKLASQYKLYKEMSIKFLTIDQYKIGAVDHLNNYAEILKTNCEVIRSKEDLVKAIIDQIDLIFVDTLGTSQKDNQHLAIIKDRLDIKKKKLKIYLTISATTKYSDIIDIMERFKFLNYQSIIFTKLDETNSFGQVLSSLWKMDIPVSFLTNGQEILETLIIPEKKKIIEILFQGERVYDWSSRKVKKNNGRKRKKR